MIKQKGFSLIDLIMCACLIIIVTAGCMFYLQEAQKALAAKEHEGGKSAAKPAVSQRFETPASKGVQLSGKSGGDAQYFIGGSDATETGVR